MTLDYLGGPGTIARLLEREAGGLESEEADVRIWKKEVGGRRGRSQKPGNAEGLPPEVRKGKEAGFPHSLQKESV